MATRRERVPVALELDDVVPGDEQLAPEAGARHARPHAHRLALDPVRDKHLREALDGAGDHAAHLDVPREPAGGRAEPVPHRPMRVASSCAINLCTPRCRCPGTPSTGTTPGRRPPPPPVHPWTTQVGGVFATRHKCRAGPGEVRERPFSFFVRGDRGSRFSVHVRLIRLASAPSRRRQRGFVLLLPAKRRARLVLLVAAELDDLVRRARRLTRRPSPPAPWRPPPRGAAQPRAPRRRARTRQPAASASPPGTSARGKPVQRF